MGLTMKVYRCPQCHNQLFPQEDLLNTTPFRKSTGHKPDCSEKKIFFVRTTDQKWVGIWVDLVWDEGKITLMEPSDG